MRDEANFKAFMKPFYKRFPGPRFDIIDKSTLHTNTSSEFYKNVVIMCKQEGRLIQVASIYFDSRRRSYVVVNVYSNYLKHCQRGIIQLGGTFVATRYFGSRGKPKFKQLGANLASNLAAQAVELFY